MDHTGDLGVEDYPFDESFEEIVLRIEEWETTQYEIGKGNK
jgi:hypothetical protein